MALAIVAASPLRETLSARPDYQRQLQSSLLKAKTVRGPFLRLAWCQACVLTAGFAARQKRRSRAAAVACSAEGVPILVLHDMQRANLWKEKRKQRHLRRRLRELLAWAVPLVPEHLRLIELRMHGAESAVPTLMPEFSNRNFEDIVELVDVKVGLSTILDVDAERALVCSGALELALYPCHDLVRSGVGEVGLSPHLCGASGRSGELLRARASSHLENVLGVKVINSLQTATKWLLPTGPAMLPPPVDTIHELQVDIISDDNTVFTEEQMLVVRLLFPPEVSKVTLKRIGIGYSSAMKFFCESVISEANKNAAGAPTFMKMGRVEKLEHELAVTRYMMEMLGGFCPQLLNYAEHNGSAAILLSLADLGNWQPRGFAGIYQELLSAPAENGNHVILDRLTGAVDFVFDDLLRRLHSAYSTDLDNFSIADELGLCKDLPDGKTGTENDLNMNSAWVLEKLWKKPPGDGSLESSVRAHIRDILGEDAEHSDQLRFLEGHPLELPNVCASLLSKPDILATLREASRSCHRTCFVHGDLHGDNIMVDAKDNRFLIDFGKTGTGHSLEDATWLESFVVLSYTDLNTDEELSQALDTVQAMAPVSGLTVRSCAEFGDRLRSSSPAISGMQAVVARIRQQLGRGMIRLAKVSPVDYETAVRHAGLAANLLLLRNALFFMAARENSEHPRRRRLALALACAHARSAVAMIQ